MKEIPLTRGFVATVDDEDYDLISQFKWCANKSTKPYAIRAFDPKKSRKYQFMHRLILKTSDAEQQVDHINGHTLDNRKSNLRISTRQENLRNRNHKPHGASGFRGVYFSKDHSKRNKPWYARVRIGPGKNKNLGYFNTAEEAAKVFDTAAKEFYGEFCGKLNFE